jgi:hypothetical protein
VLVPCWILAQIRISMMQLCHDVRQDYSNHERLSQMGLIELVLRTWGRKTCVFLNRDGKSQLSMN